MLGNRIKRARKAIGLSLRDLASQVALSHAAIKKYEDNEVTPSSDILIKLSKALHVKVEYFFRPECFTLENLQYRKHADMPEKQLEILRAKMLNQIERRVELESLFPSPPIQKFSLGERKITTYECIEKVATEVRTQWNLGLEPLPNLIDIFEEHGIKVFEIDNRQYSGFDGLSANVKDIPIIVIGTQWAGDRQRFTLAHELAHLVLNGFCLSSLDEEKCCNRFAGAFLLPKEALVTILGEHRNYIEPRELSLLKQEFGISMLGILHRAKDIRIISNSLFIELRKEFNERGWSKNEPGEQYPREVTHIFEQMVFHALAEEYIGESKAAELMNMQLELFRSLRAMESSDVAHY